MACRRSMASHTPGSVSGHALELLHWPASIRKGAPSTMKACLPSFWIKCGKEPASACAPAVPPRQASETEVRRRVRREGRRFMAPYA